MKKEKPHLRKNGIWWYCSTPRSSALGTTGYGFTARSAYSVWVRLNGKEFNS